MIDQSWQEVHDLLIEIAETAKTQGDQAAGAYLQLLVRLHNLYPEVSWNLNDDTQKQRVMQDIHNIILQTLSEIAPAVDDAQK